MPNEKPQVLLVIEDKKDVRQNIQELLEGRDLIVLNAKTFQSVLESLENEAVDLVLLDLRPPEIKGLDVLVEVRHHSADTPVVVITETGQPEKVEKALSLGAWDYVFEPTRHKSLFLNTLEHALAYGRVCDGGGPACCENRGEHAQFQPQKWNAICILYFEQVDGRCD